MNVIEKLHLFQGVGVQKIQIKSGLLKNSSLGSFMSLKNKFVLKELKYLDYKDRKT